MKYQVLEMVGISGEFPVNQLHRLIESSSYAEKIITELKNEKLIRTHYRDRLRGYRLIQTCQRTPARTKYAPFP